MSAMTVTDAVVAGVVLVSPSSPQFHLHPATSIHSGLFNMNQDYMDYLHGAGLGLYHLLYSTQNPQTGGKERHTSHKNHNLTVARGTNTNM